MLSLNWIIQYKKQWFHRLVIGGILLSSVVLAFGAPQRLQLLFIIAALGFGTLLLLIGQPNLGFIFALVGGIFVPFSGPSGLNISMVVMALMLGLWVLEMLVVKRNIKLILSNTIRPVLVFLLVSLLSFLMGQMPWFPFANQAPLDAQLGGFAVFLLSATSFVLVAHRITDIRWLKILTWVFIVLGTVYVLGRLTGLSSIDRIYQNWFTAQSMFWTWFAALVFGQGFLNQRLDRRMRVVLYGIVLVTFYVAYVQAGDWKSGWIPPLAAVVAIVAIRYWRLAILLAPLGVIVASYLANQAIATDEYSWGTRIDAWLIVTEISRASPIFGLGFANYYWYTPLFPIRGWAVSFNSHSQYVDILAQTGIIGLFVFAWIFFELGRLGVKLRDKAPMGFPRAYVYGVLGGMVGTLIAAALVDWVLPFVYNIGLKGFSASLLPWFFLGGLVSLEQILRSNNKEISLGESNE